MTTVNVYLTFDGNCEEAFNFYQAVFNKEVSMMNRFAEMPDSPEFTIPEDHKNRIMHVTLPISEETNIMGSDTIPGFGPGLTVGNNFSLSINPESKAHADEVFQKLSEGGEITMPMSDTFWGAYFGTVRDKFGINWMINFSTM